MEEVAGPDARSSGTVAAKSLNDRPQRRGSAEALRILALRRDGEAWETLLRLYGNDILKSSRRILMDEALAEDACQETLLQIRDRAGQFRGGKLPPDQADVAARSWIMRIACNTALHILRTRKRAKHREEASQFRHDPIEVATAAEIQEREALNRIVQGELSEMPEKQRRPLLLHFFGGLSYDELAQELQCNAGAARVRVHRALEKLRQRLSALGIVFTATALYTLLESSTAQAAEVVMSSERVQQLSNLLHSTHAAAINVVSDPQFPLLAKAGYAAAVATLCGSMALTSSSRNDSKEAGGGMSQPRTATPMVALSEPAAEKIPSVQETARKTEPAPAEPQAAIDQRSTDVEPLRVDRPAPRTTAARKPEAREDSMVSPVAQLKLLRMMQRDVNERVEALQHEFTIARDNKQEPSDEQRKRMEKAAADQMEIGRLIRLLADEVEGVK